MAMDRCAPGCFFRTVLARGWLEHWAAPTTDASGCLHVAPWIRVWARRLIGLPDWPKRVGL